MPYSSPFFSADCNGNIDTWLKRRHLLLIRQIIPFKTVVYCLFSVYSCPQKFINTANVKFLLEL